MGNYPILAQTGPVQTLVRLRLSPLEIGIFGEALLITSHSKRLIKTGSNDKCGSWRNVIGTILQDDTSDGFLLYNGAPVVALHCSI
jgi:hypothetical protein